MIAQFWYAEVPCTKHVAIRMSWIAGEATACVEVPTEVAALLERQEIVFDGQSLKLPFALSYGVLIAGLIGVDLTITGDESVWPPEWGELTPRSDVKRLQQVAQAH